MTKDKEINCVLSQFKIAIRTPTDLFECDIKQVLEKLKDINCKVSATKYLQLNHTEWIGNTALHLTAINKNSDVFSNLLNSVADFTIKNNDNLSVLHKILEENATSISKAYTLDNTFVNLVLSAHLKNRNFENPSNNCELSHFHVACAANNVEVVEGFLSSGVLVNHAVKADSSFFPGFTSLHFAARFCAFEVLELLLSHGADIHIKDAKGSTPLHLALEQKIKIMSESHFNEALRDKNEKILELLSVKKSNHDTMIIDDLGLSQLHVACTFKDSKVAQSILQKVVNIDHTIEMDSSLWPGFTLLHFATLCNIDTVKLLMKKGADISIKDIKGVTPFEICCKRYKPEDIYAIISLNPMWRNIMLSDGKTRLTDLVFAMRNSNQFSVFLRKLSQNFSIYNSPLWPGYTPMHLAVALSTKYTSSTSQDNEEIYLEIIKNLCENNPCLLHVQDVRGHTPLHLAYRLNKKPIIDLLLVFLNKAISTLVDFIDEDGLSYLHIAAAKNDVQLLNQMLSIGSDVNAVYKGKSAFSPEVCSGSTALHFAVINGSVEAVEILMKKGADVYAKDANDMTPIHTLLINAKACVLLTTPDLKNFVVSSSGLSHLHIASMYGKPECVESLLNKGANINEVVTWHPNENLSESKLSFLKQYEGCSPLSMAYESNISGAAKVLLKRGADIFVADQNGKALLYNVLEGTNDFDEFVEVLLGNADLQSRLKAETGMTALHIACLNQSDLESIEKLLDEGINVNARIRADSPIFKGYTALHVLLHLSTEYDIEDSLNVLVQKGADVTLQNAESETPVHMAFAGFDESSGEMYSHLNTMLEAQRDYSVNPVNVSGFTHFHIACRVFNARVVEEFLKNADVDIDQPIDFFHELWSKPAGQTALHLAAYDSCEYDAALKQLNTVDLLLKHGANVNVEDAHGDTPLHRCARDSDFLDLFERLARAGADVNAINIDGKTPLYYFLESDDITYEGIKTLLRLGCRLNTFVTVTGIGYIGEILRTIPDDEIEKLWSVASVNFAKELETDDIGRTVIHNLVSDGYSECTADLYDGYIEQLSKIRCDVDDRDKFGRTALHMAAKFYNAEGILGLLMAGADVNISDDNGETAFAYVVDTCMLCKTYGENANDRECKHLVTLEALAIHVKKLQLCGIDGNKQNEDLAIKAFEKFQKKIALSEDFFKELETVKGTTIGDQSLTLFGFLSETGAVANYPRMAWSQRKAVDKFFSSSELEHLRKKFPELAGILLLQYRKAQARPQLMESAGNELKVLVGFELPEICSDHILALLNNLVLKSLISSTTI